jgi:hypothetical protein
MVDFNNRLPPEAAWRKPSKIKPMPGPRRTIAQMQDDVFNTGMTLAGVITATGALGYGALVMFGRFALTQTALASLLLLIGTAWVGVCTIAAAELSWRGWRRFSKAVSDWTYPESDDEA